MTILVLCREDNLCNALADYARAFRQRGIRLVCAPRGFPLNGDIRELLRLCPEGPSFILHPESDLPLLPSSLTEVDVPTVCFQVDTYSYTEHRIRWSMLFDHNFLFHPGFEQRFRQAGHPSAIAMSHAIDAGLFSGPTCDRVLEVGWVGQVEGVFYKNRSRLLPILERQFRMNDWKRRYTQEEMATVYRQSKVVVNIGRDDYPQDANLRVFEAMAAGTLLLTSLPTELTSIGFEEGTHFVGYTSEDTLPELMRRYLADEPERRRIAEAGRDKVLCEHTYDCRVESLLRQIELNQGKLHAPARQWPEARVRRTYLDYFAANGALDCAAEELRQIARLSAKETLAGAALLARAWARAWRGRLLAGR